MVRGELTGPPRAGVRRVEPLSAFLEASKCCVMLALWGMTALEERAVSYCILTGLWSPFAFLMWSLHHTSLRSPDHGGAQVIMPYGRLTSGPEEW